MIEEALFDAEEKMEKAVSVAKDDLASHPDRARERRHVLPDRRRLLRRADPDSADGEHQRAGGANGGDQAVRAVTARPIETAIRNSDLGVNPTNDGNIIRIFVPAAHRGTSPRDGEDRPRARARKARSPSATSGARRWRNSTASKDGEAGEDEVGRAEKELEGTTARYVHRSTNWSSTRKPNCSRSDPGGTDGADAAGNAEGRRSRVIDRRRRDRAAGRQRHSREWRRHSRERRTSARRLDYRGRWPDSPRRQRPGHRATKGSADARARAADATEGTPHARMRRPSLRRRRWSGAPDA